MRDEGVRSAFITRDKDLAQLVRSGDLYWDFGARGQFGYHDIERYFGVAPSGSRITWRSRGMTRTTSRVSRASDTRRPPP